MNPLENLTDDLEVIADWRDELRTKIQRAHLRFEFIGLDAEEQDQLNAEVEQYLEVCRCLYRATKGRLA